MAKIVAIESESKILIDWTTEKIEKNTIFNDTIDQLSQINSICLIDSLIIYHKRNNKSIFTVSREELEKYTIILKNQRNIIENFHKIVKDETLTAKLWHHFYKYLVDPYAQINYGYATTCHKVQGSSISIVIIDYEDMKLNSDLEEFKKLLYTACTRASKILWIII